MQLQNYLFKWLNEYNKYSLKRKTYDLYNKLIINQIIPTIGKLDISEINYEVIQLFINKKSLGDNIKTKKGLSSNTIHILFYIIRSTLRLITKLESLKYDFIYDIKLPKIEEKEIKVLNINEQKKLTEYILNSKKKSYYGILLSLYTGIRIGELLSLTFDDINFDYKYLTINHTKSTSQKINSPKTKNSKRIIPLNPLCIKLIKELRKDGSIYLIHNRYNNMQQIRTYQKIFEILIKRIKISHIGFHSLTHTFATRAIETGMDIKTLSEILGHSNISITLNRYSHSLFEHKVIAINTMYKKLKLKNNFDN